MFHAEFELTNHCNTRCLHCPHETMSRPKGRLEMSTFRAVTDKIREHRQGQRYSLSFSGMGEPLLHPLIFDFVRHVSHEAKTSFASNGAALNEGNVLKLIEAGLDQIYFSFNGDESELYEKMMGGLKFERALQNLRRAIELSQGTRLKISANISVTKANRHRLTQITELLKHEGVSQPSYAMAHSRGGNLVDTSVVDTPSLPSEVTHCEVVNNTLFIDWRGRVFICDHDLHGEHSLGDLVNEPLSAVLSRRQKLIDEGVSFKMCQNCTDVLKMGTDLFADLRSGTLRDWIYDVYRESSEEVRLEHATSQQRWLYDLYEKEGKLPRLVNGLLKRNLLLESIAAEQEARMTKVHELNLAALKREATISQLNEDGRQREATVATLNDQARQLGRRVEELHQLALEREQRLLVLEAEQAQTKNSGVGD